MFQTFTVIGINDSRKQYFAPEVAELIARGKVFSGGKRHYEIMQPFLPEGAEWIDITVPLDWTFEAYQAHKQIIVFASGDPLFFGFANTLKKRLPQAEIIVYPSFNSLQLLAHRFQLPYQDMRMVSLTGRPWDGLDEALIQGESLIGVLTDRNHTPAIIAQRMLDYGYTNYIMYIGELLGNEEDERIRAVLVEEALEVQDIQFPNCLILRRTSLRNRPFGLPESEFELLDGRAKMITKMPIRLCTLSQLDLRSCTSFWDIGFCTGSVSIEAKLQFPHLKVTAFEIRPEGRVLMEMNSRRFGTPGIHTHIGDFLEADLTAFPEPDAVFIGGHGGKLVEIIEQVATVLKPDGVIVFNAVSEESQALFEEGIRKIGKEIVSSLRLTVDSHNPIIIYKAK